MGDSSCRSCGEPVVWVVTVNGKRMPIDAEPAEAGNLVRVPGTLPTVRYLRKDEAPLAGVRRYVSHFATCRDAGAWRRKTEAK